MSHTEHGRLQTVLGQPPLLVNLVVSLGSLLSSSGSDRDVSELGDRDVMAI